MVDGIPFEGRRAHRTYHSYLYQTRNHILRALGKKKLQVLKLKNVEVYYRCMTASGHSRTTVRYVHAVRWRALG